MENRIDYIDLLKGIAIFLVFLGHSIAWNVKDEALVAETYPRSVMFWYYFIYSFHMPLFFWISGFLFSKKNLNIKDVPRYLWKRTYTLIIPFIFSGILLNFISDGGGYFRYWFLRCLFEVIILSLLYELFRQKYNLSWIWDIFYYFFIFVLLRVSNKFFSSNSCVEMILGLSHIAGPNYLLFVFGILCGRYTCVDKIFERNSIYSLCLVLYAVSFFFFLKNTNRLGAINSLIFLLIPFWGSICVVYLTKNKLARLRQNSRVIVWIKYIGYYSLELYIVHIYFNFRIYQLGEYCITLANSENYRDVFWGLTCQLISSTIISVFMILLSVLTIHVLRTSNLLSICLLGRKNN